MTESAWLSWVRSALRSKSLRWPPRASALVAARRAYKGDNKLQKWEYKCSICRQWFKAKEVCVDHFPKPAGSILKFEDIGEFCNNLFCEVDNLRVLCVEDHKVHTLAEKQGISFEEARVIRNVSEIMKDKKQCDTMIKTAGRVATNAKQRKEVLLEILKGE